MAYSTQRAVSDGTLAYLDLAIGYQSRADIKVFMNDLPAPGGSWAWVGTTDKRIAFTPVVPNGIEVLVQRQTRLDRIINVFSRGAKFTNVTMDMNFEQVLYLTQEAVEGSALSDIYNDVDFHNYKIKNLGPAVADNDAITLGQVKSFGTGAYAAQIAAEAARDRARQWASQMTLAVEGGDFSAKQYAQNSAASGLAASLSATASQNSANNSASSAAASQASRLASEAARDRSELARDAAEGAAAPALGLYGRMDEVETQAATAVTAANGAVTAAGNAMPKSGGTFTGTVSGITKAMVGLGSVDNTADAAKSVNYATSAGRATNIGVSGNISGFRYQNLGINPAYLWATNGATNDQFLVQPANLSVAYAGSAGSAGYASSVGGMDSVLNWGFGSNLDHSPYMRATNNVVRFLLWQTYNDASVRSIANKADGLGNYLEVVGVGIGAAGIRYNVSDIRLKKNIAPSKVDASAIIKGLDFIEFDWDKDVAGFDGYVPLGISAQQLDRLAPGAVTRVAQPEDSPRAALGEVLQPNDAYLLNVTMAALKDALRRIEQLEKGE